MTTMKETMLKDKGYVTTTQRNNYIGLDKTKLNLDYINEIEALQFRVKNFVCFENMKKGIKKLILKRTDMLQKLK